MGVSGITGSEATSRATEEVTPGNDDELIIRTRSEHRIADFSGTLPESLDESYIFENPRGFAHIGFHIVPPTGGQIFFEGTFDGTNWFTIDIRGIESNIFIHKTSIEANFVGSIVGLKKVRFRTSITGSAPGTISGRVQMQQSTIEGIEHQNDDELGKIITEVRSSQITFIGKSSDLNAGNDDAKWQIKRILTQGNTTTTEFAADGQFTQIWNDRDTLFDTPVLDNPASLLFDGVNQRIELGDNYTFGPATAFSWSFWMKANNFAAQRALIAKTSQDANVYGYSFQHTSAGKLLTQVRAPSSLTAHTYTTTLLADVWYHICFTYAGGSNLNGMIAYINGVAEPAPASSALNAWTVTDPLTFASRGTGFHFSGNMNNISVWNKALSAAEVLEIYNGGSPNDLNGHSAVANLLSWWPLNNAATFPTEDDVKGIINGTLTNMAADDYIAGDVP